MQLISTVKLLIFVKFNVILHFNYSFKTNFEEVIGGFLALKTLFLKFFIIDLYYLLYGQSFLHDDMPY